MASLFSDFLGSLGVRHTEEYSDRRFREMPFQSMFGLVNLLKEYGIGAVGMRVDEGEKHMVLPLLPRPFLADTADGFVIVTEVSDGNVSYISQQKQFCVPVGEMAEGWNGIALAASCDATSIEPEYYRHHVAEISKGVKRWGLRILLVMLSVFAMVASGLSHQWAAWLIAALDCAGLWLSWMLVQKSLGLRNKTADAVCSALEEGGCDEIAQSEASSFMGIFKWSEVGMAYFSVSLLALLIFPSSLPALAAVNILCLPYTIWSITYQKFVAKAWCTMCVGVQATLWLLFAAYLLAGATASIFPLSAHSVLAAAVLVCCYVTALLGLNQIDDGLAKYLKTDDNENA